MIIIECKNELKDSLVPLIEKHPKDIEVIKKRNFSGSEELFTLALTTVSSGLLASLFNIIYKVYDSKKISIKYKGVEIISHKNQLEDISTFLERIEELKMIDNISDESEADTPDISSSED